MTLVGNMPRFFVDSVSGNTISIRGNDAYHIGRSLRMRIGDIITVCADRVEYRAKILSISDKEVVCDVLSAEKSENEPTVNVVLYQALPKSDSAKGCGAWSIQDSTCYYGEVRFKTCKKRL